MELITGSNSKLNQQQIHHRDHLLIIAGDPGVSWYLNTPRFDQGAILGCLGTLTPQDLTKG